MRRAAELRSDTYARVAQNHYSRVLRTFADVQAKGREMSGWQPQGYDPRRQRPATPPQWQNPRASVQPYQPQGPAYPPQHAQPYAPAYYQPQRPAVAPKSTAAGLVLGLLPPCGIGCMYAGRPRIGILLMVIWLISIPLVLAAGIGILTGLIAWIMSAVLGYTMARQWNAERGIAS
jgi:hypothetical protein